MFSLKLYDSDLYKPHFSLDLAIVSSEKFKYLENSAIFFQTACAEIHQIRVPITYIKTSQIGDHRLSRVDRGLCEMVHKDLATSLKSRKKVITREEQRMRTNRIELLLVSSGSTYGQSISD